MLKAGFARFLGAILLAATASWLWITPEPATLVSFEVRSERGGAALLEFGSSPGIAPRAPVELNLIADRRFWSYQVRLPAGPPLRVLALASQAGLPIEVRHATIRSAHTWPSPGEQRLTLSGAGGDELVLRPGARIEFAIPADFSDQRRQSVWARRLFAFLGILLILVGAGDVLLGRGWRSGSSARERGARAWRTGFADNLSDPLTLVIDRRFAIVLGIAALLALLGVTAKLHQSSIALWDGYLPTSQGNAGATLLAGTPRAIRSDEWLVHTPWMLSQVSSGAHLENPSVGAGAATLLTSVPVAHAVAAFQPEFWGFALLGAERGFSWLWMYKAFGLMSAVFLLLSILTRGDTAVSLIGAVSVWLSSYLQWWFSTNLPELLIGFCLALVGLIHVLQGRTRAACLLGTAALVLGAATFIFQFYPPFQVPLAYLGLAILIGLATDPARRGRFREHLGRRLGCLLTASVVLGWLLASFWRDAGPTIQALMQTAYPGTRVTVGGGEPWWRLFSGLFEAWRVGEQAIPAGVSNASEAGNFALLFPFVVAALLWVSRKARVDGVVVMLAVFCVALTAWMCMPLPPAFALPLAKWSLLSFVPPHRAVLALGFASCLLVPVWVAWLRRAEPKRTVTWALLPLTVIVVAAFGVYLAGKDPVFFTPWRISLGASVAGIAACALARGSAVALAAAVALLALPAATVNPLSRGLAPLYEKPALRAIVEANRTSRTGQMWMVIGSFVLPQALKANGVPTFGGATYLSDAGRMRLLDPANAYAHVWNRYGHIQIESQPGIAAPVFQLIDDPSLYAIKLDVCSELVPRIGVGFVVYTSEAPAPDLRCLDPIGVPVDGLWLYRRRQSAGASAESGG